MEFRRTDDRSGTLAVDGELTILRAPELKTTLLEALGGNDRVEIDLEGMTEVDLPCLQILCSAHQASVQAGKCFRIARPCPAIFGQRVREAGLARDMGCPRDIKHSCIWMGGWT
jgi:anti-anti-sigma regulatory factor